MLKEYMKFHVSFPIELPAVSWSKQTSWSTVVIRSILNKVPLTLDSGDSRSLSQTFSWSSHSLSGCSCGWSALPRPQSCDHNGRTGGSAGINKEPSVKDLLPGWGGQSARAPQAPLVFQFETRSWESGTRTWWLFHRLHGPFACEPKILSEWQSWRHRRRIGRTLPQRANELSLCGPPWQSVKSRNFLSISFCQMNVHLFLRLKKVRLQLMHLCLLLRSATTWMWKWRRLGRKRE